MPGLARRALNRMVTAIQHTCERVPSAATLALGPLCLAAASGTAQDLDFATSPSPVGSGARAAGMANAFIAVADDATAASWNPAGLVQLELPEVSAVYALNFLEEELKADPRVPEIRDTFHENSSDLNFASVVYPFVIGSRNFSVGLSYQHKYDFNRAIDARIDDDVPGISRDIFGEFEQSGGLGSITPSLGVEITPSFSLGVSLNLWRSSPFGDNDFTIDTSIRDQVTSSTFPFLDQDETIITEERYKDFEGENFVIGALWNVTPKWNLGLRVETGFTGDINYKAAQRTVDNTTNSVISTLFQDEDQEITFPTTYAFGTAYRVNDKLTLSFDASFTDYDDFYVKLEDGTKVSLVDGHEFDDQLKRTRFDTTQTYRLGVEYVMIPKDLDSDLDRLWTLRGGLFYDEEPASGRAKDNPNSRGDGKADSFWGGTFGVGLLLNQRVNIDFAYQYRYGDGVRSDTVGGIGIPEFEEDITQHRVILSTVIYLGGRGRNRDSFDYDRERMN